jgi:hypothetical protein
MPPTRTRLFTTTRPTMSIHILTPEDQMTPIRALEDEWARRMGIEDAPFRDSVATTVATETQKFSEEKEEVVTDEKSDKLPESVFETETPARGDTARDKQSPD